MERKHATHVVRAGNGARNGGKYEERDAWRERSVVGACCGVCGPTATFVRNRDDKR